jgi:hypothetical protein
MKGGWVGTDIYREFGGRPWFSRQMVCDVKFRSYVNGLRHHESSGQLRQEQGWRSGQGVDSVVIRHTSSD